MGEMRNAYKIVAGKSRGKIPLGRHTRSWEDNIRKDLRDMVWKVVDWMHLAQDRTSGGILWTWW